MPSFKRSFLFILMLTGLAGCSLPSSQKREGDTGSSFYVASSKGEFTTVTITQNFSIPVARTFSSEVCLKSSLRAQDIQGHEFEISGEGETKRFAVTNGSGCLVWSEEIFFNALADAKELLLERELKALGSEKGRVKVQWIINPWSKTALSLSDKRAKDKSYLTGPAVQRALSGEGQLNKRSLWIEDLRLISRERSLTASGTDLNIEFRSALKYERVDEGGVRKLEDLTKGSFQAQVSLIHVVSENGRETRRFLAGPRSVAIPEMINGALVFESGFLLSRICTRGQIFIGLSLAPVGAPAGLEKFEGLFLMGECDQMKGSFFARMDTESSKRFMEDKSYTVETFVKEKPAPETAKTPEDKTGEFMQASKVEVRKIEFNNAGFEGGRTMERERKFDVIACLKVGLDQRAVRGQTFEITKLNGTTEKVRSLDDGCLNWQDSMKFNVFANECWSTQSIRIRNQNLALNQVFEILTNPWSEHNAAARDKRYTSADLAKNECAQGQPELIATRYDFEKLRFDYGIDEFLNLEVRKQGNFHLGLSLKRPSLTDPRGFAEESLPVGLYLLRLAVVDMSVRDFRQAQGKIFFVMEKEVPVRGASMIIETIELATRNVRAMGNTNQLVVEVVPLQHASKTKLLTYVGPLTMANNFDSGGLTPVENGGSSIVKSLAAQFNTDRTEKIRRLRALANPVHYAQDQLLTPLRLSDEASTLNLRAGLGDPFGEKRAPVITTAQMRALLDSGVTPEWADRLCFYWFYDFWKRDLPGKNHGVLPREIPEVSYRLATLCQEGIKKNPRDFFDVETKYFPKNPRLTAIQEGFFRDFSITQAFSLSHGYSASLAKTWSWDASMGLKLPSIPGLDFFNASTGVRYSVTKSHVQSESEGTNLTYAGGVALTVETLRAKITADDYEKCLMIKLNPKIFLPNDDGWFGPSPSAFSSSMHAKLDADERGRVARTGFLICDGQNRKQKLDMTESYYVLNQKMPQGQILDNAADDTRPFFASLRGDMDFVSFLSYLHDSQTIPSGFTAEFQRTLMLNDPLPSVFLRGVRNAPGVLTRAE